MIFESINYSFFAQDIAFSMAVGFAVALINEFVSIFLYKGRVRLFIKDIFICVLFAVAVFSYVVSFANYPVVRIYHILAAFLGFLSFNIPFSKFFQKLSEKIFDFIKIKILCLNDKIKSIICVFVEKRRHKTQEKEQQGQKAGLKTEEVLVYNL